MLSCFCWSTDSSEPKPPFTLPSPIPKWPQGEGEGSYGQGKINLGEIQVMEITTFNLIWSSEHFSTKKGKGVAFYEPVGIPEGYFCLGHYCQPLNQPLRGYLLVAGFNPAAVVAADGEGLPALSEPLDYTLIWRTTDHVGSCYIWFPRPPEGYKSIGFIVTSQPETPGLGEVRCVRDDLTSACETHDLIFESNSKKSVRVWKTRPEKRGLWARGVSVGTFFCTETDRGPEDRTIDIACLKNLDSNLTGMPNLEQVNSLVSHYGPRIFFHPNEIYMPSSVQWFFENGARIFSIKNLDGERIDSNGSNLPPDGSNDGEYWIDLPKDKEKRDFIKSGNLESAEVYVHVKPALGGTFTDIVMWVFCPFNGPATIKASVMNIKMSRIGEHTGDWEHFTLRVSNFTGELWSMYVSQHRGGGWLDASELEFIHGEGNRPVVYLSKSGHACFPHAGCYIQGTTKLGIGVRNVVARSKFYIDSNARYKIIAAEYLGGVVKEPHWLQYMREWGPRELYDAWAEIDKVMSHFPLFVRFSANYFFELFPTQIYGEEGPSGPKEKDNWFGDERW
ncbi:uncharacterized protein LOC124938000 [Impatiens glandulifera]|uniref:uncharacterized protein LOC124938000 n=1 Tax=Impatiens glandulifera TaxID=253017 RepID=UPI001FB150B8|nr:uncharacterized protein LOC124938000 [Impatiens glandulifera]